MNVARKYLLLNLKNIQGLPPELLRAVLRTLAQRRRAPQLQPAPQPRDDQQQPRPGRDNT